MSKYGYDEKTGTYNWKAREEFADRHGRKCAACGKENLVSQSRATWAINKIYETFDNPKYIERKVKEWQGRVFHIDHIVPKSKCGTNDEYNLQLLCATCNRSKRDMSMDEFLDYLETKQEIESLKIEVTEFGFTEKEIDVIVSRLGIELAHKVLRAIVRKEVAGNE